MLFDVPRTLLASITMVEVILGIVEKVVLVFEIRSLFKPSLDELSTSVFVLLVPTSSSVSFVYECVAEILIRW